MAATARRPRLLDLYCCAGGAAVGYERAGFEVVGVDIAPRPNYPHRFIQMDALAYLAGGIFNRGLYDAVHASPPCQKKCTLTVGTNQAMGWGREHVDLVAPTRTALLKLGLPYVLEQPNGRAEIRKDVKLCGEMFGLGVLRHRNFELGGWTMPNPPHVRHRGRVRGWRYGQYFDGPYVAAYGEGGGKATVPEMQKAMGIDWTDVREELTEALPPAFTEHIGRSLLEHLEARRRSVCTPLLPAGV